MSAPFVPIQDAVADNQFNWDRLSEVLLDTGGRSIGIRWGTYDDGASWGGGPQRTLAIPHKMNPAPVAAAVISTPANSTASATDPVGTSLVSIDSTNINVIQRTLQGGNCNFPGVNAVWIAIG